MKATAIPPTTTLSETLDATALPSIAGLLGTGVVDVTLEVGTLELVLATTSVVGNSVDVVRVTFGTISDE